MNITKVTVEYSELRSKGYPSFNNVKYGVSYEAEVNADTDNPDVVRRNLFEKAMREVKMLHGDDIGNLHLIVETVPSRTPF